MASIYKTKQGDMRDYIAKTQCGSELAINELLEANQDYKDTVIFSSGVTLTIPGANIYLN